MAPATSNVRGRLLTNEPMSRHTVWAVGGPADYFFAPADEADLAAWLVEAAHDVPVFWLGLGSNLLVRDGGIEGVVVSTNGAFNELARVGDTSVRVDAGVPCAKVARLLGKAGLRGGEFLAGIPGTMGGALAMNAGAHGGETWDVVSRVRTVARDGQLAWREPAEFDVSYRSATSTRDEWFVGCELKLSPSDPQSVQSDIKKLLAHRAATQPTGQRSCGSVFRNPPGDFAGRLVEAAGLKGERRGQAVVSPKHANFIVNEGGASAADVESLIEFVKLTVSKKFNVELHREVHVVGRHD
jgi:UDP-N-acetylmuramate dehydrogenase